MVWPDLWFENNIESIVLRRIDHLHSLFAEVLFENQCAIWYAPTTKIPFWRYLVYLLVAFGKEKWFWDLIIVICFNQLAILIEVNFIFRLLRKSSFVNISTSCSYQNSPLLRVKNLDRVHFFITCVIWFFLLQSQCISNLLYLSI